MNSSPYILVTAARNEAAYITKTLESVTAQTLPPKRWLIVSDGSTDETDEIVCGFAARFPYIELLRVEANGERNFGSKALAVNAGYEKIRDTDHLYVGILDADVSFDPDYYEQVIRRFESDRHLGIAGGVLEDVVNGRPMRQMTDPRWSVSGPVQMFRRECWQVIGGYLPIRGGIDAAAEVTARMNGWTVRAYPELRVLHYRRTGAEKHGRAGFFFHTGLEDHHLGYHPVFFLAKSVRRFRARPFIIGGLLMLCGYAWAVLSRKPIEVPAEVVRYWRREQMQRLRARLNLRKEKGIDQGCGPC